MYGWLARRFMRYFEQRYDYDMSHMRALLTASPRGFRRFVKILAVSGHNEGVPAEAAFAARLVATISEDCGPCTELVVRMGLEAGVPEAQIEAVLERSYQAMSEDTALAVTFAERVLAHDPEAESVRENVRARWGEGGLATLALAIAISRVFPMLKAGLGYAKECRRIELGGRAIPVNRAA